jgi:predicted metal-dependent hydrolase
MGGGTWPPVASITFHREIGRERSYFTTFPPGRANPVIGVRRSACAPVATGSASMSTREETRLVLGRPLRLRLRRSTRARNLHVLVSARDGVEVVVPRRATLRDVDALLAEKARWIARQADHYQVWNGPRRRSWATGSELPVLGVARRLVVAPLPEGRIRPRAELGEQELRLELPGAEVLDPRPALERWLRRFAAGHLRERTAALAAATGLRPRRVMVGERRSRWGSCSHRGTISYCYRLVMAPTGVVDAVVTHELCHLRHPNHGRRFYALVRRHCPDHDRQMDWLRRHGGELEL